MKTTTLLAATLGLALQTLSAQTVPTFINYQGRVTDSEGVGLVTGTPVNRKIVFRIYDAANAGTKLWTEEQTVTISDGEFSVLLGQGIDATGTAAGEIHPAIASVFTSLAGSGPDGASRFIGVTVDNGNGTIDASDIEIAPRQQITSTAYAFRADVANKITAGADSTFTGTTIAGGNFTGSTITSPTITGGGILNGTFSGGTLSGSSLTNPTVTNGSFTGGTFSGNGSGLTNLNASQLTSGTVPDSRLSTNVPFMNNGNIFTVAQEISTGAVTAHPLRIKSSASASVRMENTGGGGGQLSIGVDPGVIFSGSVGKSPNDSVISTGGTGKLHLATHYNVNGITIDTTGSVGVGTTTPRARLEVSGYKLTALPFHGYMGTNASVYNQPAYPNVGCGIYANSEIWASAFRAFSDERIKRVAGRSDTQRDLAMLQDIEVTDYTYIDTVMNGSGKQKKLIAQQVEKVFPQAVNQSTDVVPDIYQEAELKDGWVELATNLKKGERVRLIGEKDKGNYEVLEVRDGAFRTAFKTTTEEVFVFGREVSDFRSVDYEAIAMLNVSATQQIKKEKDAEVGALKKENAALRVRIAKLEQHSAALESTESRLIAIEKQLKESAAASSDAPPLKTVSAKR